MDVNFFPQKLWIGSKKKDTLLIVTVGLHVHLTGIYVFVKAHRRVGDRVSSKNKREALSLFVADHVISKNLTFCAF